MGQLIFNSGKLTFNDAVLPHKFWGMTPVLDFDVMTIDDWVKIILSEFLVFNKIVSIEKICFLLPHQNLFSSRVISSADTMSPSRMMVDYYYRTLKLGLTASLSSLIGDVLPTDLASKFLSDRRLVFLKALKMISAKATNFEPFGISLGVSSMYHMNKAIEEINNDT